MKKQLTILLLFLFSCSSNNEQEAMEMLLIDLKEPETYKWFDNSNPETGWIDFKVEDPARPYQVQVEENRILVKTQSPIKTVIHLRGQYGNDKKELELLTETSFEIEIENPHPYAETFRIYF